MTSEFECEVRFSIKNHQEFKERLKSLKAKLLFLYEFADHYFKPKNSEPWDPQIKTLRIREWRLPKKESEVLFTKTEKVSKGGIFFKRSLYPKGKIQLIRGTFKECRDFLSDLGFEEWFSIVKKKCELFEIPRPNFKVVSEYIEKLGWSGELEVEGLDHKEAAKKLLKFLSALKIKKDELDFRPLSKIYVEKFQLFK